MKKIRTLRLAHPEPERQKIRLVPVFLPFAGCPGRCVFCDQQLQTGVPPTALSQTLEILEERLSREEKPFALGFFGGTFTGLDERWQDLFLTLAARFRASGQLQHLRLSTRPDRISAGIIARLRRHGVDMVELGVQTFDTDVLRASGRGYAGQVAEEACRMVREGGLDLGIQLLPGLPGHGQNTWREDVDKALRLAPSVMRIYPCVVMAGTELDRMFIRGEYSPWSLGLAVAETGWAVLRFWEAGIRVIRLGLANEGGMLAKLVAGPWHPAFGSMVRSEALRLFLQEKLAGRKVSRAFLPSRLQGELWGHGRANAPALEHLGINRDRVAFWPGQDVFLDVEE